MVSPPCFLLGNIPGYGFTGDVACRRAEEGACPKTWQMSQVFKFLPQFS